jgi:hypothetical protein
VIWLAIAVGGALGSMARHGVNVLVHGRWPMMKFPLATAIVNVTGCLIIGLLAGLIMSNRITPRLYWREFVFVGSPRRVHDLLDVRSRHRHTRAHALDDAGAIERHRTGRVGAAGSTSGHPSRLARLMRCTPGTTPQ